MWSIWNAPSDRDYYDRFGWADEEDDEPEYCGHCGARWDQVCEEWCYSNAPARAGAHRGRRTRGDDRDRGLPDPVAPILNPIQSLSERRKLL
jgi:hypothetical protein